MRGRVNLSSPDIYGANPARREAYMLRGDIRPGNSGGPMITPEGEVAGMVFGASDKASDETGFALTAAQLRSHSAQGGESEAAVPTGACVRLSQSSFASQSSRSLVVRSGCSSWTKCPAPGTRQ